MVVGEAEAELAVDVGFVAGVGFFQDGEQAAEGVDHFFDLCGAQWRWRLPGGGEPVQGGLGGGAAGLGFAGPGGDEGGVGSGFQGGAVLGELAVQGGDLMAGGVDLKCVGCGLGVRQRGQ
ncbi:hypothetical protein [Streptomyces sp. NPDC059003]|uniref:hypothetical protein n=1 Tax=Streptomyces sp. NPDC059003 TaxID=3346691 RepID=UPI0036B15867